MGKLGYSTYTLTDLTETLPISLVLETNQEQNIQTKEGEFYTPNFEGEELIITPSLFLGSIEKEVPTNYTGGSYIYYETGEMEELEDGSIHEKQYYYYKDNESEEVYVDIEGRLHYKKNLTENLTIEAYIKDFKNKVNQDYVTSELVRAQNPITILLLEQGKGIYTLVISSSGNREHFEENNKEDIVLTATLYKGAESILSGVEYEWDIVTDTDTEKEDDDYSDENNKNDKTDFISRGSEITIQRADVNNIQVYQCTATFNGLEFSSQKIIRDFTDGYTNQLIANNSLILTPNNLTVTLTNQVWYQTGIINGDSMSDQEKERFEYEWILLKSDNETEIVLSEEKGKKLEINLNNSIYPRENFSILGKVTIDKKTVTVNYADIKYQPVAYSVNVSPKTIFIPTNADGTYRSTGDFAQKIKFQLLDDKKQSLDYILETDSFTELQGNISVVSQTPGKWDFTLEFNLTDFTGWEENQSSKTYEFGYTYLNQSFTEEFEVVKNYAGADGEQGFSGYTIDLSNEFHAFAGGEMRADSDQSTTCTISAYFGDQKKKIQTIALGSEGNIIYGITNSGEDKTGQEYEYILSESKGALYISSAEGSDTNEVIITIRTNTSGENEKFLMGIEPIKFFITIEKQNQEDQSSETLTFFKTFTYTINYNGKSYYLNLSSNSIKYTEINQIYDPSNINVSALCRETSGQAVSYTNGKIVYSLDNKKTWKISTGNISGYKNLENIYIRLYSAAASDFPSSETIINEELIEFEKYLLDTETIPILTSMEGYEFGGENLIRWSKELPIENNKWVSSSNLLSVGKDGDFSTLDFMIDESAEKWINFKTPKITLEEEYIGKTFCFSCYVYSDDWSLIKEDYASIAVIGATTFEPILNEDGSWIREGYRSILCIDQNGPVEGYGFSYEPEWKTGDWIKIYKTFTLDESFFNSSDLTSNIPTLNDFKYLHLDFYLGSTGSFRIKKPKLELGNIPSSWSASPYDINLENITGINLLDNIFQREIKFNSDNNYRHNLADETVLQQGIYYSLSYKDILNKTGESASLYLVLEDKNDTPQEMLKKISIPSEDFSFLINSQDNLSQLSLYSYDPTDPNSQISIKEELTCFIRCLKLEKGKYSTSWSLTDEQIDEMLDLQLINYSLLDEKGNIINFASQTDFEEYMNEIDTIQTNLDNTNNTVSVLNTNYNTISSTVNGLAAGGDEYYLGKISKGTIRLGYETDDSTPFLILSSEQDNKSFSMQLTNTSLAFYQNEQLLAEMTGYNLNIPFLKSSKIKIGNIVIKETPSGVGILWEEEGK